MMKNNFPTRLADGICCILHQLVQVNGFHLIFAFSSVTLQRSTVLLHVEKKLPQI
jgi:hypothetical protein